jgi:hypothetical protein
MTDLDRSFGFDQVAGTHTNPVVLVTRALCSLCTAPFNWPQETGTGMLYRSIIRVIARIDNTPKEMNDMKLRRTTTFGLGRVNNF